MENIHELKIAEDFNEFLGESVDDENISFEDTTNLLNTYIDSIDTQLDKEKIKNLVHNLYVESLNQDIC